MREIQNEKLCVLDVAIVVRQRWTTTTRSLHGDISPTQRKLIWGTLPHQCLCEGGTIEYSLRGRWDLCQVTPTYWAANATVFQTRREHSIFTGATSKITTAYEGHAKNLAEPCQQGNVICNANVYSSSPCDGQVGAPCEQSA